VEQSLEAILEGRAVSDEIQKWPISKWTPDDCLADGGFWEFVEETEPCTMEQAFRRAHDLNVKDSFPAYRIWDCR
jgi:hypothetical protein